MNNTVRVSAGTVFTDMGKVFPVLEAHFKDMILFYALLIHYFVLLKDGCNGFVDNYFHICILNIKNKIISLTHSFQQMV